MPFLARWPLASGAKNGYIQGKIFLKPEGADTSKLQLAKLHYVTNICTISKNNYSKTVGGVCDTKLLLFCTKTNTQTHRQTG